MPQAFQLGIGMKVAAALALSGAAISAVSSYLNVRLHRRGSQELVLQSADRISRIIQRSTRYQMLHHDREALYQTIRDLGAEPGLRRIRIFNKEGRVQISTDPAEVNRVVNKQAEACYGCHAQGVPIAALKRPDRARIFEEPGHGRVLAMIQPIDNEPSCSSAACHAHRAGQRVLGVIDTHLSLAAIDAQAAEHQRLFTASAALVLVLLCALSAIVIWRLIHRPIQQLIAGTKRIAAGDLSSRIGIERNDELGELAASFDRMTEQLANAHAQNSAWAATLEERVKRKSEELERAHQSMANSEKMASLGKLAATVAHEVNNPLFGILTYARLGLKELEKAELPSTTRERLASQLRIIERESKRCGEIMKNLLTFARQAPRRPELASVNDVVARAVALVRHEAELRRIALHVDTPELPPLVCDQGQIQQVVLVLLMNAIEAMESGGDLYVATSCDGGEVRVVVEDTGSGIPADVLPRIFEAFYTTKDEKLRTGLGLAVALSIIEQHGGTIQVDSGPGARFTVALPLRAVQAGAA